MAKRRYPKPKKVRTYGPAGDRFVNTLYHTRHYSGANTYDFFTENQTTVGSEITNITNPGQVPSNENYEIKQISLSTCFQTPAGAALAAVPNQALIESVDRLLFSSTMLFDIKGKSNLGEFPLSMYMSPINAGIATTSGMNQRVIIQLPIPVSLAALTSWSMKIKMPVAQADLSGKVSIQLALGTITQRRS